MSAAKGIFTKLKLELGHIKWPRKKEAVKRLCMILFGSALICLLIYLVDTLMSFILGVIL